MRISDIPIVSFDRPPGRKWPRETIPDLIPDLLVEVPSKSNTRREVEMKLEDFFRAGCRLAWVVDPKKRTVRVHTDPKSFEALDESATLDGGDVLPGLAILIRSFLPPRR